MCVVTHKSEDDPKGILTIIMALISASFNRKGLNRLDITFDLAISSPKARARQTAEIIADEVISKE